MRRHTTSRGLTLAVLTALLASGCASSVRRAPSVPKDAVARSRPCRKSAAITFTSSSSVAKARWTSATWAASASRLFRWATSKPIAENVAIPAITKMKSLVCTMKTRPARFVVMGYGLGANTAAELADAVQADGATIDLLVYCGGIAVSDEPKYRPSNVRRSSSIFSVREWTR